MYVYMYACIFVCTLSGLYWDSRKISLREPVKGHIFWNQNIFERKEHELNNTVTEFPAQNH